MASKKKTAAKRKRTTKRRHHTPTKKRAAPKKRRAAPRAPFSVGDDVKLIFEADQPLPGGLAGERMWVRVTRINGRRAYGYLNDDPIVMRGIRHRSRVSFDISQPIDVLRG